MNRSKIIFRISLSLIFIAAFCATGNGQVQHGGKPFNITKGLKGEEVLYILPPPDPLEIEAKQIGRAHV